MSSSHNDVPPGQEIPPGFSTAILTVSDTASKDPSADGSGQPRKRQFKFSPGASLRLVEHAIVPDDHTLIQEKVKQWIDVKGVRLVLTTGGTGFGMRDGTPEAITPLITKLTPGLSQALTAYGLSKTPLAALSRLTSGIRQVPRDSTTTTTDPSALHGSPGALIIALPGSAKAVKECLDVLLGPDARSGVLIHALQLCAGDPDSHAHVEALHNELHGGRSGGGGVGAGPAPTGTDTDTGSAKTQHAHQHPHPHQAKAAAPPPPPQPQPPPATAPAVDAWDSPPPESAQNNGHDHGSTPQAQPQPQPQPQPPAQAQQQPQKRAHVHFDQPGTSTSHAHSHDHSGSTSHAHVHSHTHTHSHAHPAAPTPTPHAHAAPKPRTAFLTHSPHGPSTARSRQSPYPILPLEEALALIEQHTPKATRRVVLAVDEHLVGYVLAQDVKAAQDLPIGNTTNVDGYAVSVKLTPPGEYAVVTASELAQRQPDDDTGSALAPGEVCRVNTGQALPLGTDGVVMVEDTELVSTSVDASGAEQESRIKVLAQIDPLENVRKRGSDVRAGQIVLQAGTAISALGGEIGTLAFLGVQRVAVWAKPRVAVLSTGDELRELQSGEKQDKKLTWGFKVYDANRPGLKAAIRGQGLEVVDLGILGDETDALIDTLKKGLESADVILTTGGTSMGESDLLKPILERELSGTIHFGRVSMKPGKPTTFATVTTSLSSKVIFALPGNPASALVTFYVFVLPALRKMTGYRKEFLQLPRVKVTLATPMRLDRARPEFHRAIVMPDENNGNLKATSTGAQRSSGMNSMSTANALVCLPVGDGQLQVGELCDALLLGGAL